MGECFICRRFGSIKKSGKSFYYTYSGNYTESTITDNNINYTVLTLISSGELIVNREIEADVWLCGGGGMGANAPYSNGGGGGGGGYVARGTVTLSGSMVATVASSGGYSSFGPLSANAGSNGSGATGGTGGSGGGSGDTFVNTNGGGAGTSTQPFLDSINFPNYHCGGGGGGACHYSSTNSEGGKGGSNGSSGSLGTHKTITDSSTLNQLNGGAGGLYGGGKGGNVYFSSLDMAALDGTSATYYGSGGGGGGGPRTTVYPENSSAIEYYGKGGYGYQGVIYIRWKTEDAA